MGKNLTIIILAMVIMASATVSGVFYTEIVKLQNEKTALTAAQIQLGVHLTNLNAQVNTLEATRDQLNAQVNTLEATKDQLNAQLSNAQAQVITLEQQIEKIKNRRSQICLKENACKFSQPGGFRFRCDAGGAVNERGKNWCECNLDCEVDVFLAAPN